MRRGKLAAWVCAGIALGARPGAARGQCDNQVFEPFVSYPTGVMPDGVTAADINADELLDLILTGNGVQVLLGMPGGVFGPPTIYLAGSPFKDAACGDIDNDGDVDIVATENDLNDIRGVRVLLNNGSGVMSASFPFTVSGTNNVQGVVLGHLNSDEYLDIVAADYDATRILIWLSNGAGGFVPYTEHPTTGSRPYDIQLVDMNGDSELDVVTANEEVGSGSPPLGSLIVLLNSGAAQFVASKSVTPRLCWKLDHGDLDDDGDQDIVVVNDGGTLRAFFNTGAGAFDSPVVFGSSVYHYAVALADLDLDDDLDAVFTHRFGSAVSVFTNNGSGSLQFLEESEVTENAFGLTAADFDGDGKPDVAVGSLWNDDVSILINKWDYTPPFTLPEFLATGDSPIRAATGDVTGDGIADLIVSNSAGGTVTVAAGFGDGSFAAPVVAASLSSPGNVVLGDIDGDEDQDLLVVRGDDYMLIVFGNTGSGAFVHLADYALALGARPALGDLDGDGDLDLAWNERLTDRFVVRFNDGAGGFGPENPYIASSVPYSLSLVDLDGDGDLDAATPNFNPPRDVSVFLNDGSGAFAPQVKYAGPNGPIDLRAGDLDSDGDADLVVINGLDGGIGVLKNNGDATFSAPVLSLGEHLMRRVELIDADSDGGLDLVFVDAGPETAVLIRNDGTGLFDSPELRLAEGALLFDIEPGDLNGDGSADLVATDFDGDGVHIMLNLADPLFRRGQSVATGAEPSAVALLDVDGDTIADLVVANEEGDSISVALGLGDGSFSAAMSVAASSGPAHMALADLDGDSDPDLAYKSASGGTVSVMLNDGSGGFVFDHSYGFGGSATSPVALGDLNGDTLPDMVTTRPGSGISVRFNEGGAEFGPRVDSGLAANNLNAIVLANVDGDSDLDIVVAETGTNARVLLNNGTGGLSAGATLPLTFTAYALSLGDLDGDLDLDLVLVGGTDSVAVRLNSGAGAFSAPDSYSAGVSPRSVTLADADLDGSLDIIIGSSASGSVSVLLNEGTGTFACETRHGAGPRPSGVASGDVDDDGDIDLVVSARNGGGASALLNRTLEPSQPEPCPGNANGDAVVDFNDIVSVLGNWLADHTPGTGEGDANADSLVDFNDIVAVLANWLNACP